MFPFLNKVALFYLMLYNVGILRKSLIAYEDTFYVCGY